MGYNTDFSKIAKGSPHPVYVRSDSGQQIKSKTDESVTKSAVDERFTNSKAQESIKSKSVENKSKLKQNTSKSSSAEKSEASMKVRASSRTPKPKRTFSLIEDEVQTPSKASTNSKSENISSNDDVIVKQKLPEATGKVESSTPKMTRKSNKFDKKTPKHIISSPQAVHMTTPLSKRDVHVAEMSRGEGARKNRN